MAVNVVSPRARRAALAAVLLLAAVLVVPSAVDPFNLVKATVVWLAAAFLAATWCVRVVVSRRLSLARTPVSWAVLALAIALLVATVTSSDRATSLVGWYARYMGLASYLGYLIIFLAALGVAGLGLAILLRRTALVALACVVGYGLLQVAGVDPVNWVANGLGSNFSFLGNVDFAAAWTAAVLPMTIVTVSTPDEPRAWKWLAGVLLPLGLAYAALTRTSQGLVVLAVSCAWTLAVLLTTPGSRFRAFVSERRRTVAAAGGAALVLLGAAAVLGLSFIQAQLSQAMVERPAFWSTAVRLFASHPVVGTGLNTYGDYFLRWRPASHAIANGPASADAPHSVFLAMFSNGGVLLGLSWLALVVVVGWMLVRGVKTAQGAERLALAGFGGVWVGYQLQALVSYDVPALAVLHWLSATVIVATAGRLSWREVTLPGPLPSRAVTRRGKEYGPLKVPASSQLIGAVAVLAALAGAWFALYPLRADLVAASAASLGSKGQLAEASARLQHAASLNTAEGSYLFQAARAENAAGQPLQALSLLAQAAQRDPGNVQYALFAGQVAAQAGDHQAARHWFKEAARRDPKDPKVLAAVADYFVQTREPQVAREYLQKALRLDPQSVEALQVQQKLQQQASS